MGKRDVRCRHRDRGICTARRSEEHTSELQSQSNLVCRLLLEKKKNIIFKALVAQPNHVDICSFNVRGRRTLLTQNSSTCFTNHIAWITFTHPTTSRRNYSLDA